MEIQVLTPLSSLTFKLYIMKKITFFLVLFLSLQGFSQKTFEVYNFSGQTINLGDIITRAISGTSFVLPEYHSKPFGNITIAPGGSYVLENTSYPLRFPFNSPASVPYISIWERNNTNGTTSMLASNSAWALGNSQVFFNLKFFDGANILREVGETNPTPAPFSTGITAEYSYYQDPVNTNIKIYTVVIY